MGGPRIPPRYVYLFSEGDPKRRDLLGGKGAGLAAMTRLGLPVPPGFTIATQACNSYAATGRYPDGMWPQVDRALAAVEKAMGRRFGDANKPLLVSVRSGAAVSMPGMMDTVLNVGLNDATVEGLAAMTGDERFAYDSYRRLLSLFGRTVLGLEARTFESILDRYKGKTAGGRDADLTAAHLKSVVREYKAAVEKALGEPFPQGPKEQLRRAVAAVFRSWRGKRAVDYRNAMKIPHDLGTAANVQAMVFGNLGTASGTGVAFTRNPATGAKELYGEYLATAQGEDVVAGIRTPMKIAELKQLNPKIYREFERAAKLLEAHFRDLQDLEFTVENGKLWMLQVRTGKRTAQAAVKVAADMARERLITKREAVERVEPQQVYQLMLPRFDDGAKAAAHKTGKYLARGLNASPGAATGLVVFDPNDAERMGHEEKQPVILVRTETSPDDVHGMLHAKGILTSRGGATSHASVVARGLGLPCVVGCEAITVDYAAEEFRVGARTVHKGELISIDGATGEVFAGRIPLIGPDFDREADLRTVLGWADEVRRLQVWANADYPRDAERSRRFGAQGIGLCRTEHMFFEEDRLPIVQRVILAAGEERQAALEKLLPIQRSDFVGIFEAMGELPVVIRLIDPPLHEFLPKYEDLLVEVTELRVRGNDPAKLAEREKMLAAVAAMREVNPMLGLRGCRLGIMVPGVTEMQVRAIFEAACAMKKRGVDVHPEIMIPLVGHVNELKIERGKLEDVAKKVMAEQRAEVAYKFGTMIEIPRAALTADAIARYAEFFSFGTNDLTQTTYGYSRDDAEGKFLMAYVDRGILPANPFQVLDRDGVGALMRTAVERGRRARKNLKIGICGEHGGDPESIAFCEELRLDYVSCSPFRVPVARLAAAHAVLRGRGARKGGD